MPSSKVDRRVLRTRDRLGDALVELILEKPFDSITVQDVLDRAGVGRATFYSHFKDKDDLFLSDVDEYFEHVATILSRNNDTSDRVAPVRELFAHVAGMRHFHEALATAGKVHDVMDLLRGHLARGIEQRFTELPRARGLAGAERKALAHAHAGAFVSLLSWWISEGTPETPEKMDELYHRTVWSGVDSTGG